MYLGDLPVDASAQLLFGQVWKLSHCVPLGTPIS
jgi:hypothetical protein